MPPTGNTRKKSAGGRFVGFLFVLLVVLFASGLGRNVLEAISNLLNR